ncbi:hypothetical protein [Microbacterium sp. ZW T5_56]|uniref:hypothetical protein n=1 Tax=Microbacterium sp. ZW T5_56 TaxID=3378081 RepID=UPI003854D05E
MKNPLRATFGTLVGAAMLISAGVAGASAAEPGTPPWLPFDPFEFSDSYLELPTSTVCDVDGIGIAEFTIALSDEWGNGTTFTVTYGGLDAQMLPGTSNIDPADVIGTTEVEVLPGTWETVELPVDERGLRVWVDADGRSWSGVDYTQCRDLPSEPMRAGNSISVVDHAGITYVAAPREVNGDPVECFVDGGAFVGCWVVGSDGELVDFKIDPTASVEIPQGGLRVWALADTRSVLDFGFKQGVTTSWAYDYMLTEVTPAVPTQNGNVLTIPDVDGVEYRNGNAGGNPLEPGEHTIKEDTTVVAVTADGYVFPDGADTEWTFSYTPDEVDPQPVPVTPAAPTQDRNVITIPDTPGVAYQGGDGNPLEPGVIEITEDTTITAVPEEGYDFPEGATQRWTFEYVAPDGGDGDGDNGGDGTSSDGSGNGGPGRGDDGSTGTPSSDGEELAATGAELPLAALIGGALLLMMCGGAAIGVSRLRQLS